MTGATPSTTASIARRTIIPSSVIGTLIFIGAEIMFFAGVLSAFTIIRATALPGMWPPPDQPRLPAGSTAINTVLLFASGAALIVAYRRYRRSPKLAHHWLLGAWLLGMCFVGLQGVEWVALLQQGLTIRSSTLGSFFYLVVGGHALHAVIALGLLAASWVQLRRNRLSPDFLFGTATFWFFVVGAWPFIYARVYF